MCYIRTGMDSRNYNWYSLNDEGHVGLIDESRGSRGCLWWGWQGAGLGCELCRPLSTPGAAERRGSNAILVMQWYPDSKQTCRWHCESNTSSSPSNAKARKSPRWTSGVSRDSLVATQSSDLPFFPGFIDWFFVIQWLVFSFMSYVN
jgi:hypothetical protein